MRLPADVWRNKQTTPAAVRGDYFAGLTPQNPKHHALVGALANGEPVVSGRVSKVTKGRVNGNYGRGIGVSQTHLASASSNPRAPVIVLEDETGHE